MQNTPLTDPLLRRLKPPAGAQPTYHWDAVLKGFGVRVSPKGTRTFVVLLGSGKRRTVGRYPELSLADARAAARRLIGEKMLGRVRPDRVAFDDAKALFLADKAHLRESSLKSYRRRLERHFRFGRTSLADIAPRDIQGRLTKLRDTPGEQEHAFVAGKVFFQWCARQQFIDRSPMANLPHPRRSQPRERILSDTELAVVYRAAEKAPWPFGAIVQLLILTGQRRGEIAGLRWEYIEGQLVTLPGAITKNKRTHYLPLTPGARRVIDGLPHLGGYVFPAARTHVRGNPTTVFNGWPKAMRQFRKAAGIDHFTLHDLRRTFSSGLASLGVAPHIIERCLNHVTGVISGVAATYNRYAYEPEMRAALEAWERKVLDLVAR